METTTTAANVESIVAGSNSTKWQCLTNCEKMAMVRIVQTGESIRGACQSLNIIPKQYQEWTVNLKEISKCNPGAKSIAKGSPSSLLNPIESDNENTYNTCHRGMSPVAVIQASMEQQTKRCKIQEQAGRPCNIAAIYGRCTVA
jgi:hypothetical protein